MYSKRPATRREEAIRLRALLLFVFAFFLRLSLIGRGPYYPDTIIFLKQAQKTFETGQLQPYLTGYTLPILIIRAGAHIRWSYTAAFVLLSGALGYFFSVVWQAGGHLERMFPRLPAFVFISMMLLMGIQLFTLGFLMELMGGIKLRVDRLSSERAEEKLDEPEGVASGGWADASTDR